MTISVIGSGAFGTALAISLARKGPVFLWARNAKHAIEMKSAHENTRRLPGAAFPDLIHVTADIAAALDNDVILLAVPLQQLRNVLKTCGKALAGKMLVACCKGIELNTGKGPVQIIQEEITTAQGAILTGPSFAHDIAKGLPTALTLACADAWAGKALQKMLTTPNIRIYRTTDTIGAELGGALKNVVAIACGATIGAGLGDSARAALMTRGYAEMQRMAHSLGADPNTLSGLSGFGDLALTCSSEQSRNYQLGLSLGRQIAFDPSITVEGAATARAVIEQSKILKIELPITDMVVQLLDQKILIQDAMASLLARPLKEE
ncbi:MAG: NAD(P)H-dependent glycerol-3-phosphate dehydrogenase [Paracoccaceae bacterium]